MEFTDQGLQPPEDGDVGEQPWAHALPTHFGNESMGFCWDVENLTYPMELSFTVDDPPGQLVTNVALMFKDMNDNICAFMGLAIVPF